MKKFVKIVLCMFCIIAFSSIILGIKSMNSDETKEMQKEITEMVKLEYEQKEKELVVFDTLNL